MEMQVSSFLLPRPSDRPQETTRLCEGKLEQGLSAADKLSFSVFLNLSTPVFSLLSIFGAIGEHFADNL